MTGPVVGTPASRPAASAARIDSPIGPLRLTAAGDVLTGLGFVGAWTGPATSATPPDAAARPDGTVRPTASVLIETARQLDEYFAGARSTFDLPLAPEGDTLHRAVWDIIAEIPYGSTVSYGSIAERLAGVRLSQAVGGATGRNPLALVVPCHRVVGKDGTLTGFGGGLDRKRYLLALEESCEVRASRLF